MASLQALSMTLAVLYYVSLPIVWIFQIAFTLVSALVAPIVYLARFMLYVCWLPIHILILLEVSIPFGLQNLYCFRGLLEIKPLYVYLGIAVVTGGTLGFLLHGATRLINTLLSLDESPEPQGMTVADYRAKRAQKQAKKAEQETHDAEVRRPLESALVVPRSRSRRGNRRGPASLMSSTIFEEEDSSEDEFI